MADALGDKPMCGGCGAKVGRAALASTLIAHFGDDAAEVQPGQVMTTDHLRSLTHDPVTMTRIAAIHALGDIWAMGATPQAATLSLTLPRMTADLQARTLIEITETAADAIGTAGGRLIGGHTALGDELVIGFTITGLTDAPITLAGAMPGDQLILTKPLGSGTIMAAEMQGKARGADVMACLAHMMRDQAQAATILKAAHAMTDVTGFGLAGHLRGLCDASGVGACINLPDLPVMAGARGLSDAGIWSTLYPDNVVGAGAITGPNDDMIYDPQTAGGLLAAVPANAAKGVLQALQNADYPAAIIGEITEGTGITTHQA